MVIVFLLLGLLGIITVGVNVVVNGLDKMAQLEARFKGIEEFQKPGSFLKSIGGSALSKQELDTVIKDVEAQLAKDLARGGVSDPSDIITGKCFKIGRK
mgnify:CR=1 FL=1